MTSIAGVPLRSAADGRYQGDPLQGVALRREQLGPQPLEVVGGPRDQRRRLLGDDRDGEGEHAGPHTAERRVDRQRARPAGHAAAPQPFDAGLDRHPQRHAHEQDEQRRREAKQQREADDDAQHHQVGEEDAAAVPAGERGARGQHAVGDGVGEDACH